MILIKTLITGPPGPLVLLAPLRFIAGDWRPYCWQIEVLRFACCSPTYAWYCNFRGRHKWSALGRSWTCRFFHRGPCRHFKIHLFCGGCLRLPRYPTRRIYDTACVFLGARQGSSTLIEVVLDSLNCVFCWRHKAFTRPDQDFYLRDRVHLNARGQYLLYRSYRCAILTALSYLWSVWLMMSDVWFLFVHLCSWQFLFYILSCLLKDVCPSCSQWTCGLF